MTAAPKPAETMPGGLRYPCKTCGAAEGEWCHVVGWRRWSLTLHAGRRKHGRRQP
jgi:hypothetical protein